MKSTNKNTYVGQLANQSRKIWVFLKYFNAVRLEYLQLVFIDDEPLNGQKKGKQVIREIFGASSDRSRSRCF